MKILTLVKLATISFLVSCSWPVTSGDYYLIEESRYLDKERSDVCKKLVENFNAITVHEPMVCDIRISPKFGDFSIPKWTKIDAVNNFDIIKSLQTDESINPWNDAQLDELKNKFKNGQYSLYKSKIDINHDGRKNAVYRIKMHSCDNEKDFGHDVIGYYKYYAVPNSPSSEHPKNLGRLNGSVHGTLFLYKGRPYFHAWKNWPIFLSNESRSVEGPSPRVAIYETSSPHTYESYAIRARCEIGYKK